MAEITEEKKKRLEDFPFVKEYAESSRKDSKKFLENLIAFEKDIRKEGITEAEIKELRLSAMVAPEHSGLGFIFNSRMRKYNDEEKRGIELLERHGYKFGQHKGIERFIIHHVDDLEAIEKAAGNNADAVIGLGLQPLFDIIDEYTWDDLVKIIITAGEDSASVVLFILPAFISAVDHKTWPKLVETLMEIMEKNHIRLFKPLSLSESGDAWERYDLKYQKYLNSSDPSKASKEKIMDILLHRLIEDITPYLKPKLKKSFWSRAPHKEGIRNLEKFQYYEKLYELRAYPGVKFLLENPEVLYKIYDALKGDSLHGDDLCRDFFTVIVPDLMDVRREDKVLLIDEEKILDILKMAETNEGVPLLLFVFFRPMTHIDEWHALIEVFLRAGAYRTLYNVMTKKEYATALRTAIVKFGYGIFDSAFIPIFISHDEKRAELFLRSFIQLLDVAILTKPDVDFFAELVQAYRVTRRPQFFANIIMPGIKKKWISLPLSKDRDLILRFINSDFGRDLKHYDVFLKEYKKYYEMDSEQLSKAA